MGNKNCGCSGSGYTDEINVGCTETPAETCDDVCKGSLKTTSGCCTPKTAGCCVPTVGPQGAYYEKVSTCPEDNTKVVCTNTVSQVFKSKQSFCMPDCGARIRVVFEGISDVAIGAWMWAYGIGFLEVAGFNPYTSEIELENPCPEDPCQPQVPPGTPIPACTVFVLTVPPCSAAGGGSSALFPYLASTLIAPANGECVTVAVTTVNGISVNQEVSINTGVYRVDAVISATQIRICNDGQGLPEGTVVEFSDANGNFIVPIILIDSNPCSNSDVLSGKPLACSGGSASPLAGSASGQILTWDEGTEEASFRTLGIPTLDCTELTVCLTLDPNLPSMTPYLVTVVDTSAYSPTDVVTIGGTQFVVDSIVDGTQMYVIPVVDPVVIQTYPPGSILCAADCCQQLAAELATKADAGDNNDITRLDALPLLTWTPSLSLDGGATISNLVINRAHYQRVGRFIHFLCSLLFDVTNASSAGTSDEYTLSLPATSLFFANPTGGYTMHLDDNGMDVPAFWRPNQGTATAVVFQADLTAMNDGVGRIEIDGKFIEA